MDKIKLIERAIEFYSNYPTGQYDDQAVLALQFVKVIISGCEAVEIGGWMDRLNDEFSGDLNGLT